MSSAWVVLLAPLTLQSAVQRAMEVDPGLQAVGLQRAEAEASEAAAGGIYDLVLNGRFDANTRRQTARNSTGDERGFDTSGLSLDSGLVQRLPWGTSVSLGWLNVRTNTENPFAELLPGVASNQTFYETRLTLSLRQPLMRGAGRAVVEAPIEQARHAQSQATAQRRVTASGLVEGVVIACLELAKARADAGIRSQALELARKQLAATRARIETGQLARADLPVVEQAVAEREQALFLAEQRVADLGASLRSQLHLDEAPQLSLPDPVAWAATLATARAGVETHPELALQDAEIARRRHATVSLHDAARPQLDLSLVGAQAGQGEDYGGALSAVGDNQEHFYGATVELLLPVQNRAAEGDLERSEIALRRLGLQREARRQALERQAETAWRAVKTAEQAERLAERLTELAGRTLAAEQGKLEAGRTTNLDVLQVQQQLAEARLAVAQARADRLLAVARLQSLTGALLPRFGLAISPDSE